MKDLNILLAIAGFALALGGNITWAIILYGNSEKKKYAAERDFNHLRNNQSQISDGIADGFEEMDRRFDTLDRDLLEIKAWMIRGRPVDRD